MTRHPVADNLREIAEKYFNLLSKGDHPLKLYFGTFDCGICGAYEDLFGAGYMLVPELLVAAGYPDEELEVHYRSYTQLSHWEERAYFCLMLAEMLEDGTLKFQNPSHFTSLR